MRIFHAPIIFKFLKGADAITLYPFIFYKYNPIDSVLLNHEKIHIQQIKKIGVVYFYFDYIYQYVTLRFKGLNHNQAYFNISYEKEAYTNQGNLDYDNQ